MGLETRITRSDKTDDADVAGAALVVLVPVCGYVSNYVPPCTDFQRANFAGPPGPGTSDQLPRLGQIMRR